MWRRLPGRRRAPEVEQSTQAGALPERVRELGEWLAEAGEPGLTRSFDLWLGVLGQRWGVGVAVDPRAAPPHMERLEPLAESYDRACGREDRTRPNVRGRKFSWFVMLALLPVARITNRPCPCAYVSEDSSAFRYATAP